MRPLAALALCVALATAAAACSDDATVTPTVQVSGTAYGFGSRDAVGGAVVRVAEVPGLEAVSDAKGDFALDVPDGRAITLYVTHADFTTMHTETFTTAGADLDHVFLQMVTPGIFATLAGVLGVTPDPTKCQFASTVSEIAIQGLDFPAFSTHGPHGVAGATVSTEPFAGEVTYFNASVIPDGALTETSRDGGVVWTNIDPGVYRVTVSHPDKTFAAITVTCEPGRFLNASPPWGLHER